MKTNFNNIGRREFFNKGIKAAAATTIVSSVNPISSVEASVPKEKIAPPGFIIDSHIHCGGTEKWVEDMVRIYRPYNAMACVLTWMNDMDLMVEAMKSYPDLFIGYGRVDLDDPNAIREVEKFKKAGFVGMKFHSPQKNFDDPSYYQVYRLCEEYGLCVWADTDTVVVIKTKTTMKI